MITGDELVCDVTEQAELRAHRLRLVFRIQETMLIQDKDLHGERSPVAADYDIELRKENLRRKIWDRLYGDLSLEIVGILDAAEVGGMAEVCGRLAGVRKMLEYPGDR